MLTITVGLVCLVGGFGLCRLWMAYGAQDLALVTRECKLLCDRLDAVIAALTQKKGA